MSPTLTKGFGNSDAVTRTRLTAHPGEQGGIRWSKRSLAGCFRLRKPMLGCFVDWGNQPVRAGLPDRNRDRTERGTSGSSPRRSFDERSVSLCPVCARQRHDCRASATSRFVPTTASTSPARRRPVTGIGQHVCPQGRTAQSSSTRRVRGASRRRRRDTARR